MVIKINPAMIIFLLGCTGFVFVFVGNTLEIGSKIPLTIFFVFVMVVGIVIQMTPKSELDETFGEQQGNRGFG